MAPEDALPADELPVDEAGGWVGALREDEPELDELDELVAGDEVWVVVDPDEL